MSHIVFLDTETTGLSLDADIWEFAAIVRDPVMHAGDAEIHMFIEHDLSKTAGLPESFRDDHDARYDPGAAFSRAEAAVIIAALTDGAHIVGAVPNFDTERLALLLRANGIEPSWRYHLIDVENLAVGWIHGRYGTADEAERLAVELPWDSDEVSAAVGVVAPEETRHTALGDARWARDIYDAVVPHGRQEAADGRRA